MPLWAEIPLALLAGPFLWLAGAVSFDAVHAVLHAMLRSRFAALRALAWPHAVHHAWIDRELQVHMDLQRRNVLCHLVPEYLTQLAFTGGVALLLPWPFPAVLALLQTGIFAGLLRQGGLDVNHRPIRWLDAYAPGPLTPPAYHALHHVYPDAYYSAYTKAVDALLGRAAWLGGRRFALRGGATPFGRALAAELLRAGAAEVAELPAPAPEALAALDVLVLCDAAEPEVPWVEAYARATRERRLPPEVWAVHRSAGNGTARHYHRDVRVTYRSLVLPSEPAREAEARRAARRALARVRRGFHLVSTSSLPRALAQLRRFRRTEPARPPEAPVVRHRAELAAPEPGAAGALRWATGPSTAASRPA